jgi:hypothetical protein
MYIASRLKVVALISLLGLAGCAGMSSAPTSISLDLGAEKSFKFKNVNAEGKQISSATVASVVAGAIYQASGFQAKHEFYEPGSDRKIANVQGIEVTQIPNAIKVTYLNGEHYADYYYQGTNYPGKLKFTSSSAIIGYTTEEQNGLITIKLVPPKQIDTVKESSAIFIPYNQLANDAALSNDMKKIMANLTPILIQQKTLNGEINVSYPVNSVTANFKRKCGYSFSDRDGKITCTVEGLPVSVELLPYKDGSKAAYKFAVQYSLNGNGESTYAPGTENKVIESLQHIVQD